MVTRVARGLLSARNQGCRDPGFLSCMVPQWVARFQVWGGKGPAIQSCINGFQDSRFQGREGCRVSGLLVAASVPC